MARGLFASMLGNADPIRPENRRRQAAQPGDDQGELRPELEHHAGDVVGHRAQRQMDANSMVRSATGWEVYLADDEEARDENGGAAADADRCAVWVRAPVPE